MTTPHQKYLDELVIHLRLRSVPGEEIGAFIEEARDHLESSGENPEDAFGPVEDYARDLAVSKGRRTNPEEWSRKEFGLAALHFTTWFILVRAAIAWILGEPFRLTITTVFGLLAGVAIAAWVVWPTMVRYATGKSSVWLPALASLGAVAGVVIVLQVGEAFIWGSAGLPLIELPASQMTVIAAVAMILTLIPLIRRSDPVRRPN